MSIEQPVDPQLVEQTKQQIRASGGGDRPTVEDGTLPRKNFMGSFCRGSYRPWRRPAARFGRSIPKADWPCNIRSTSRKRNFATTRSTRPSTAGCCTRPFPAARACSCRRTPGRATLSQAGDEAPAANPTGFLLLLGLLKTDLETIGVVEIFQRAEAGPTTQKGYLRFLMQMCELAGDFLKSHQLASFLRSPDAVDPIGGFHAGRARLARSPRNRLYDRQRGSAADRLRPRERGDSERQEVQDRGHQRPGPVRQAVEHGAAARAAGHGGGAPAATPSGTRATPATCRRRSKTRCRSTSTRRTRRPWPCCRCSVRRRRRKTIRRSARSRSRPSGP